MGCCFKVNREYCRKHWKIYLFIHSTKQNFFVNKRKNKNYIPDDPTEIQHVDEVMKLLQVMTGDARYKRFFGQKKEGVHSMCDVAERLEKMGWEKGIEQGIEQGSIRNSIKVYKNLLNLGFGKEEARKIAEVPENLDEKEIRRLAEQSEDMILK